MRTAIGFLDFFGDGKGFLIESPFLRQSFKQSREFLVVLSDKALLGKNWLIEGEASDQIGKATGTGFQEGHREELVVARKEEEIAQLIVTDHLLSGNNSGEEDVLSLLLHLLLEDGIAIRDTLEGEAAEPQEEKIRISIGHFQEIQDSLSCLDLTDGDDDKAFFWNAKFLSQLFLLLWSRGVEDSLVDEVGNVGDSFLLDSQSGQGFEEAWVDDDDLLGPAIEGDDITAEERKGPGMPGKPSEKEMKIIRKETGKIKKIDVKEGDNIPNHALMIEME